ETQGGDSIAERLDWRSIFICRRGFERRLAPPGNLFFYTLPLPGSLRQRARSNIIRASKFAGFSAHWRPIWNHERRRQTQRRRAPDRGRRQDQAENQEALHVQGASAERRL